MNLFYYMEFRLIIPIAIYADLKILALLGSPLARDLSTGKERGQVKPARGISGGYSDQNEGIPREPQTSPGWMDPSRCDRGNEQNCAELRT